MKEKEILDLLKKYNISKIEENFMDLNKMNLLYNSAIKEVGTKLDILNEEFKLLHKYNPIEHIKTRVKTPESIIEKLMRKNLDISFKTAQENLKDIAGIRVVCSFLDDIYKVSNLLLKQSDVSLIEIKDYIKSPKESGYRSLHLIISIPVFLSDRKNDVLLELQIRTVAMDFWASLEHKLRYKNDVESLPIKNDLKKLAEQINQMDLKMSSIHTSISNLDD